MNLKIALLQLLPGQSLEQQMKKGAEACSNAAGMGADIALFPEMWSNGYHLSGDREALLGTALERDSEFVRSFSGLACHLKMATGITFLERRGGKLLNSVVLYDREGKLVLHYSKVHTCGFEEERVLEPGEEFPTADLDTGHGTVRVGSMICFDREFPESARILMLRGAEVILAPNACPMEINRLCALRTRAYENMLAVATCNYPLGQPDCNGHSTVFDGVAWLRDEPGVRDMCILEAPETEGIYLADLDLDRLRAYREREVMGWKWRRPGCYDALVRTNSTDNRLSSGKRRKTGENHERDS